MLIRTAHSQGIMLQTWIIPSFREARNNEIKKEKQQ